ADEDEADARADGVAAGGAAVPGTDAPRAAAQDKGARIGTNRIFYKSCLIFPLPVTAPLPDVAVHVVQLPRAGLEALHRRRESETVIEVEEGEGRVVGPDLSLQGSIGDVGIALEAPFLVAGEVARGGAGAAGKLPLRLSRQPILPLLLLPEPLAEGDRVV